MATPMSFLLWLVLTNAWAQDGPLTVDYPIDIERFRPSVDSYGYVLTESSTTLHNLEVGVGMWGSHAQDSLVLQWNGERVLGPAPEFADAMIDQRSLVNFQTPYTISINIH